MQNDIVRQQPNQAPDAPVVVPALQVSPENVVATPVAVADEVVPQEQVAPPIVEQQRSPAAAGIASIDEVHKQVQTEEVSGQLPPEETLSQPVEAVKEAAPTTPTAEEPPKHHSDRPYGIIGSAVAVCLVLVGLTIYGGISANSSPKTVAVPSVQAVQPNVQGAAITVQQDITDLSKGVTADTATGIDMGQDLSDSAIGL